jgi:surface polysaccharide O-acyltransferase-like enzyme
MMAVIGYLMCKKYRPEHYENRSEMWWFGYILYSIFCGPLFFVIGLIAMFVKQRKIDKEKTLN